jgi:dTMP kinase
MAMRGRLIVFEGPEGAGKTTQLRRLEEWLAGRGATCVTVREPGGTALGEMVRALLLDSGPDVGARAEALLFMASRAQVMDEVIEPALTVNATVLMDRFFLSTYAYQIAGRGLSEALVRSANELATGGHVPDLTLLLTASAETRRVRREQRGAADRIELAGADFHARVEHAFALALTPEWQTEHPECGRIIGIPADDSEAVVFDRVLAVLNADWPELFPIPLAVSQ